MTLDVRTIEEHEFPEYCRALSVGFLRPMSDVAADAEARRGAMIWDRTWAGFDGGRMVSTFRSFPVRLTVPGGGSLPTSAITAVTTSGTHRRQGLATRMMTADLRASQDRGEAVAVLHASEWPIYGRFGFGAATIDCTLIVDASAAVVARPVAGTATVVSREEARALLPAIYAAHVARTPGELSRDDRFHDLTTGILWYPSWGEQKPVFHVVVHDEQGTPVGLLHYGVEDRWEHSRPRNKVKCDLMVAADPTGSALLWQYLIGLDLISEIEVDICSVADPLPFRLTDARHVRQSDAADGLWVRLLDVPVALSARTYLRPGRVVIEVTDPLGVGRRTLPARGRRRRRDVCHDRRTGAADDGHRRARLGLPRRPPPRHAAGCGPDPGP